MWWLLALLYVCISAMLPCRFPLFQSLASILDECFIYAGKGTKILGQAIFLPKMTTIICRYEYNTESAMQIAPFPFLNLFPLF